METQRTIRYYKQYFLDFYSEQSLKVQEKIEYVFTVIKTVEHIPKKFFDKITERDGLYEIRVEFESNIYRIFCCLDEGHIVILFNAFQKKTQKTPQKEINMAEKLKKEYFTTKEIQDGNK
jgi:phage-related protein